MQPVQLSGCKNGPCPKIFRVDGLAAVQGSVETSSTRQFAVRTGWQVVEIPLDILVEAGEALDATVPATVTGTTGVSDEPWLVLQLGDLVVVRGRTNTDLTNQIVPGAGEAVVQIPVSLLQQGAVVGGAPLVDLSELFAGFQKSAWRHEAQDNYDIPEERGQLAEFVRTGKTTPSAGDLEYQQWLRDEGASGRTVARLRLVGEPLTPYTLFELAYFHDLVEAGEDVRILPRAAVPGDTPLWKRDFFIFDDRDVALMHYDEAGHYLGAQRLTDCDITPYLEIRRQGNALGVPFTEYHLPRGQHRVA